MYRERARGYYTTGQFFCSKLLVDLLPLRAVPPALYALISYYMMGLNGASVNKLFVNMMALVLVNLASTACAHIAFPPARRLSLHAHDGVAVCPSGCYAISAGVRSAQAANLIAGLYFVFSVLFGGVLLTARNASITGVMYLSIINFAFRVRAMSLSPQLLM